MNGDGQLGKLSLGSGGTSLRDCVVNIMVLGLNPDNILHV
jgi:hypothetical protein